MWFNIRWTDHFPQQYNKSVFKHVTSESEHQEEFVSLLTKNQSSIRAYILSGLGNYVDADDVLQKTNLVLWKKSDNYQPGTNFIAWAISVARFEILHFLRENKRDRLVFNPEITNSLLDAIENQPALLIDRKEALADCMQRLPEKHRSLLAKRYGSNMKIRDIAAETEKSEDAMKSLFLRIRKQLESCIRSKLKLTI